MGRSAATAQRLDMDVIKVEPPDGDVTRREPPFAKGHAHREGSLRFAYLNAGKRSVTLDIAKENGRKLLLDLVARLDVVLEDFAPGYLAERKLGYDVLLERQKKLIRFLSRVRSGRSVQRTSRRRYRGNAWAALI